jgi:DNA-binding GntR family transcriptional regulator
MTASASLSQSAYERMRAAVVHGEIDPGEAIVEVEVATLLRMSRTPVREALQRLELEGYLERDGALRLVVHPLTEREVAEMFTVRQLLEGHAVRLAVTRISDAEMARLDELVEADQRALRRRRMDELARINHEIHEVLVIASRNRTLEDLLRALRERIYGLNAFAVGSGADQQRFVADHATLAQLLRNGDDEAAVALVHDHLARARDLLLAGLREGTLAAAGLPGTVPRSLTRGGVPGGSAR